MDALFEAAERVQMRLIAGKVLMDRNAPEALCDTPETAYSDTKALIEKWHGKVVLCMRLRHDLRRLLHLSN